MFGVVFHPRSVARQRAVAELSVTGVRRDPVREGHVLLVPPAAPATPVDGPPQLVAPVSEPVGKELEITVDYRLKEYLQVLADFAPMELHSRAVVKGTAKSAQPVEAGWFVKLLLIVVGSLAFVYKVNKVGDCRFKVDGSSIDRASKGGTLTTPWPQVVGVFKLSGAYLIQKSNGAMPLPFRCMSESQRAAFEHIAGSKLVSPAWLKSDPLEMITPRPATD